MVVKKQSMISPHSKISVSWVLAATVCLTGYYFARQWALDQRVETLEIRKRVNDDFEKKLDASRAKLDTT